MKNIFYKLKIFLLSFVILFLSCNVYAGNPLWTFTPLTATTISLPTNSTATIQYAVVNQSNKPHTLMLTPFVGITQITTGLGICGSSFTLPTKGSSCILSLQINGSQLVHSTTSGPIVCQQNSDQCYKPVQADNLNITLLPSLSPTSGSSLGGTSITITGPDLTYTSAVTFDGIAALSFNVNSSSSITAITPPHTAGIVDVAITTPGGTVNLANAYTYVDLPTLLSISPASGSAAGNAQVTLTGTNLSGTTTVTLGGVDATSVNVINSTTVTAVTPPSTPGIVDVTVTTADGSATLPNAYIYDAIAIGQNSGGGTIACLGGGSFFNLIAAAVDNSSSISWGALGATTNATSTTDGTSNTNIIVNVLGPGASAAQICVDYQVDSAGNSPCLAGNTCYADWFMPAQSQLNCLYTNKTAIGGFSTGFYWSSTEQGINNAVSQNFSTGSSLFNLKNNALSVRCVRVLI